MQNGVYLSLSGQIALNRRLETVAANVANGTTPGYRAEEIKFESLISPNTSDPTAFAAVGSTYLSRASGEIVSTGNPLDVAVEGDSYLAMMTPVGTAYTRDGRFKMRPEGDLQTLNGYPVLDAGGAPIQLDPNGGPPTISRDGIISQNNRQVSQLGLFTIDPAAKLTRYDNSGVIPDRAAVPALDFTRTGVQQGFIERSNVNPIMELSRLILIQRQFEAVSNAVGDTESTMTDAIKSLGATT
ncbi:MAG: flagellar basal-body rod protein FlgF [Hyphomicrobiaceae bacterium]